MRAIRLARAGGVAPPWAKVKAVEETKREKAGRLYNPMRQLTAAWLSDLHERAEQQGDHPRVQYLYKFVEKRYGVLRAVKKRRLAAIGKLDWEVKRMDDSRLAKQQQAELEAVYGGIRNLKRSFKDFARAEFRGFTVVQILTDANGWPERLAMIPHHHIRKDGAYGNYRFCPAPDDRDGQECVGPAWIIREVEDPINELASINFIPRLLGKQDFSSLVETVGDPPFFLEMPPGITEDEADEYQALAEAAIASMKASIPNGSKPHFAGAEVRNGGIFKELFDELDTEVVIAATSGKLTVMSEAQGMGGGQAATQDAAFDDLAQDEAGEISEILDECISKRWLDYAFPGQPHLAYFCISATPPDDTEAKSSLVETLGRAGYKAKRSWVEETFGIPLEEEPLPADPAKPALPAPLPVQNSKLLDVPSVKQAIAANLNADFEQIRNGLTALLQQEGAPTSDSIKALLTQIENAQPSPETLALFEELHAASLLAGWEEAQQQH